LLVAGCVLDWLRYELKRFAAEGIRGRAPARLGEIELLVVGRWRMYGRRVRTGEGGEVAEA
jgi:hypothetical protein